jgi:pilus assembly protein CpaC
MNPQPHIADVRYASAKVVLACAAWLAALAPLATGQAPPPPPVAAPPVGAPVQITVRPSQPQAQLINVAVNQGALVDFSVPVREVRIANPEIADVTATGPRQILVTGKSYGTTQLMAQVDGGQQQTFTVAVDVDLARLEASIHDLVPRAAVKVSALLGAIVLTGNVPDAESAERIVQIAGVYSAHVINQMRVAGVYQVVLRCTVAEVDRTATRSLGFNGWMAGDNFKDAFAVSNLNGINPVNISPPAGYSVTSPIPFATGNMALGPNPTLSLGFPRVEMQIFIQALRENGLLKVLAEPNLVAVSGQEADFLAGGEFPIPVPQGGTNNAITIEFREFGVRLRFTPTVLSEDVIRLQVAPEISEPDYSAAITIGGYVVPGLTQRRVDTVVELGAGQTFAIGGLLSEKVRGTASKVPALGDMPVLGALFSSVRYQSNETELVVLVTPELVAPLNPDQVTRVPGADHIAPNDWELFGLGKLEGEGGGPTKADHGAPCQRDAAPARADQRGWPTTSHLRGPIGPAGNDEGA